ncbi:MAG: hypothetical protein JNL57_07530 [Bacteroidetes bacterium]|nr:hypothetical protein [Bacteroidota bacterium]
MQIYFLTEPLSEAQAGGKAASVSYLLRKGLPVPPGFVIPSSAYTEYYLAKKEPGKEFFHAVEKALHKTGADKYMVRSSAVGEDGRESSFAGQLDSFICSNNPQEIVQHIQKCWASSDKENVKIYSGTRNQQLQQMAVLVQALIEPEYAGVFFSRNPENDRQWLLEYVEGHGEKLVSGAVNPERAAGNWDEKEPATIPFQLEELLRSAIELEVDYQTAVDMEFAVKNGVCWLVQCRPVTSIAYGPLQYWSNTNVNENYPEPLTPILYSIARDSYYHYFKNLARLFCIPDDRIRTLEPALINIIGAWGARMYYNVSSIHEVISASPFAKNLRKSFDHFVGYTAPKTDTATPSAGNKIRFVRRVIHYTRNLNRNVEDFEMRVDAYAQRVDHAFSISELQACYHGFLEIRFHSWYKASLADFFAMLYHGALGKFCSLYYAQDSEGVHNRLIQAIPGLVSSEPIIHMYRIRKQIEAQQEVKQKLQGMQPEAFWTWLQVSSHRNILQSIQNYIDQWGFRCSGELMLTVTNYCEKPELFIALMQQYLALPESDPEELIARRFQERQSVISEFRKRIFRKHPVNIFKAGISVFILNRLIHLAGKGISARERARLKQAKVYFAFRRVLLRLGHVWTQNGLLREPDDIFYLRYQEVAEWLSGSYMLPGQFEQLIKQRREEHEREGNNRYPDDFATRLGSYPAAADVILPVTDEKASSPGRWTGLPVCGGKVQGRARVLNSVMEADKLLQGDILITRQTDPGWVVVFPLISGLVVERGGMLSHGAIVSREFGIPAIVGVESAADRIPHGARIELDANTGVITLLDE